jgi:hypothetical protein
MRAFLLATAIVVAAPAWAQQTGTSNPAPEMSVVVAVATAPDQGASKPGTSIDEEMDAYIRESPFAERERRGEIAVLRGVAVVGVRSNDPRWVAERSLAYQEALLNAQADYVVKRSGQITTQTASEMFKAADREPPSYAPSDNDSAKAAELIRKLVALGTGQIDEQLRDLGINPADYERAPEPQRYVQMRSALTRKSMEHSFDEIVGLTPVQTFEQEFERGSYKIGVVAVVSPRMKDFAQRVLAERGQFPPDPTRASKLADLVADKSKLVHDFGVRWQYDEAGLPVIVSFAQWASDYHGQDPITVEEYRDIAFKQAELEADAQIADFLKGSVNVVRSGELGRQTELAADRMANNDVVQEPEVRKLASAYQASIKRQSNVSITGLTTLARWSAKHPETGQTIIGVVRIWSAAGEQAMRTLRDVRPQAPAASALAPSSPGPVQTGRVLMDANDF